MPTDVERSVDRTHAFGVDYRLSLMDRVGMWLSDSKIRRVAGGLAGKRVADIGCGHDARFARRILDEVAQATLVDVTLADDLKANPKVAALEGKLPTVLAEIASGSLDFIVCNNVLEHLWVPREAVEHVRRLLAPRGIAFLNVPSWSGRLVLETAAFRLKWTTAPEIDDHKAYYDTRELWRLLVEGGFKPSEISCHSHKFGLNTYAVCTKSADPLVAAR
jgi:2-polyprenyl-3-methyl-5-hydroxy-6-metoxy-1,4-benzoquinol methylase